MFSLTSQGNSLKHLSLGRNHLLEIPSAALLYLKQLLVLNLNDNRIELLKNEDFMSLQKVIFDSNICKVVKYFYFLADQVEFVQEPN